MSNKNVPKPPTNSSTPTPSPEEIRIGKLVDALVRILRGLIEQGQKSGLPKRPKEKH